MQKHKQQQQQQKQEEHQRRLDIYNSLFTVTRRKIPFQYQIESVKHTAIDKLHIVKHNDLLVQGISNFLELPNKWIKEYLQSSVNKKSKNARNSNRNTKE